MTKKEKYLLDEGLQEQLPVFYHPWWLSAVYKNWDVAIVEDDGKIVAAYPFQKEKIAGITLIRPGLMTAYNAPYILENYREKKVVLDLMAQLPSHGLHAFISHPAYESTVYDFLPDFEKDERITFIINLNHSSEQLFQNLEAKRRNDIRKAMADLTIEECTLDVETFYKWHKHTFLEKKAKYPYSISFLKRVNEAATKNKACLCLQAKGSNGINFGIAWFVFDSNAMYYLLSAANPEVKHRGAISLLIWNAILIAKRMNLQYFDFEGSMNKGIASFFSKFGGEEKPYFLYQKTNSFLWRMKQKLLG